MASFLAQNVLVGGRLPERHAGRRKQALVDIGAEGEIVGGVVVEVVGGVEDKGTSSCNLG